jgi:hypothetical protein
MKLVHSLLDYSKPWALPDVYLFTGNPIIRNDGAIVMGRGAAKQVRDTYTRVPYILADKINRDPNRSIYWATISKSKEQHIGWFKVKEHWQHEAKPHLVQQSVNALMRIAIKHSQYKYHINYPAIGNGKLSADDIAPMLISLPNNVIIYK